MDGTTTMQGAEQEVQDPATDTQAQQAAEDTPEKVNALQKFINGLFGKAQEPDGAEKNGSDGEEDAADVVDAEGKAFTQADLDAAVEAARKQWEDAQAEAKRIESLTPEQRAEEEQKKKDTEIENLRSQLLQKELREDATKVLEKDGYPAALADVLDYSSKERMEETLKKTTAVFKESLGTAVQTRLRGKTPEGLGVAASAENLLRDQIAKNIRGL